MINRTQGLALGFLVLALLGLVVLVAVDPEVYGPTLRQPFGAGLGPAA